MLSKLLLLWVFIGANSAHAFCVQPFKVGFEEWPPYQIHHNASNHSGFDAEFLQTVLQSFACPLEFVLIPWNHQQASLAEGKIDLALGVSSNAEREKYAYFSKPYRQEVVKLFVLAKDVAKYKIDGVNDLKNLNILLGAELGYYYGQDFAALMKKLEFAQQVRMVINTKLNVQKLAANKIDAFLADQNVGNYYINKFGYNELIVPLPVVINAAEVKLMVSRTARSENFVKKLDAEIAKAIQSEQYKMLEDKYLKK
jgi:polar amino acid transport system substrate-binding protein